MSDLISRCELFNRLATIPAPAEANEFKAKIYEIIQSMETADVAYIYDREKCERCDPRCDLTRDKEHAATTEKAVLLDGISRPQGEWIPCSERLPEIGQKVLASTKKTVFTQVFKGYYSEPNKWVWENNSVKTIEAWQLLPKPWKGAANERL